ncbi:phosphonate metabolism protein/1,5-bisphosphokinase (PRPP-forming) PhnN [Vibrio sp.]|uniref:phosphonate metabolism protein/1,5-bisphosphokinase (PRPP-forming) PhnN n=1 Tax=Vibrio sp. TaxID=678 RepID=UPI003D1275B3
MPNITQSSHSKGTLFYVIGASGVGKDSLLHYARQKLASEPVVFAHRYITRPVELNGENHIRLSTQEFANRLNRGCFKFHWHSHELDYGIGTEVDTWLNQGLNVVMNGSRGYLDTAIEKHPGLIPVLIQVDLDLLRERLLNRGRETPAQIDKRIQRAQDFTGLQAPNMQVIENNAELGLAGDELVKLLKSKGSSL